MLTSIGGHEAWKFELPGGISAGMMFEMLFYVSALVSNLPVVLWNIYKYASACYSKFCCKIIKSILKNY